MNNNNGVDTSPHSTRFYSLQNGTRQSVESNFNNNFEIFDDEVVWNIKVPGTEPEKIRVFQEQNKLVVRITISRNNPYGNDEIDTDTIYYLTDEETVEVVQLALGVLSIHIERNIEREEIFVNVL